MRAEKWIAMWMAIVLGALGLISVQVFAVDPFFHYHKPLTDQFFYRIDNGRSQNDGIIRHFDYDVMITGTSMTQNFRTTEADELFGGRSIKVAFAGSTYREVGGLITKALQENPNVRLVIRSLDMQQFLAQWDAMRTDLGTYPAYLYDKDPLNDVHYLLNRDVLYGRVVPMYLERSRDDFQPGTTSFDAFNRWQDDFTYGIKTVCPEGITNADSAEEKHLTEAERETIRKNIEINVTDIADQYPDVKFYCFYPPYSIVFWNEWKKEGTISKQLEAEAYITELLVQHENIHLFSFNNRTDITTDLNNYKDKAHYGGWINSLILKWMHDGACRLTKDNYEDYLREEADFYTSFDYGSLNGQEDYEADLYAGALTNEELTGTRPLELLKERTVTDTDLRFEVDLDRGWRYLYFEEQRPAGTGKPAVSVFDEQGREVLKYPGDDADETDKPDDGSLQCHVLDLSTLSGKVTIVMSAGTDDGTEGGSEGGPAACLYQKAVLY